MFRLKSTHRVVKDYFGEVHKLTQLGAVHEGAVAPAFAYLLRAAAQPFGWTLAEQYARTVHGGIVKDPTRADDSRYIVNLIGRVIAVSLETVQIVAGLPAYGYEAEES